jgi:hypothetical protein
MLPALHGLLLGDMDPGLRRDDGHADACGQLEYSLFRRNDEKKL